MENFSFSTIVTNITTRLKLQTMWQSPMFHSFYNILIETIAFGINKLAFLSYSFYRESGWWTASQRNSLIPKTRALGYVPKRNQCPFGAVEISADPTFSPSFIFRDYSIPIPKWTVLSDSNGNNLSFVIEDSIYYKDIVGSLDLNIKVGIPKNYRYISNGIANETFNINSSLIDNDEIEVFIVDNSDVVLSQVTIIGRDELYFINDTTKYYCEIASLPDFQGIYVKFGDNVNTNNVIGGTNILVKYAETNGSVDNISISNVIVRFNDTLYNSIGVLSTLYINQTEALSDGSLLESLEDIKYNAPINFDTAYNLNRLINYSTFLPANVSYINKFIAWTNESLGGTMSGIDGQIVYGSAVSNDGSDLTNAQKNETLLNWIKPYKSSTEVFQWENLQKIYTRIKSKAYIPINVKATDIINSINTLFFNTYNITKINFKQNIYNSEINSMVQSISNVNHSATEIWYMETGLGYNEINYVLKTIVNSLNEPINSKQILIKFGKIEILLKRKIGGVWQNAVIIGTAVDNYLIGMNGYTITGSFIDYINGWISYNVLEIANDVSHAIYGNLIIDDSISITLGYQIAISYQTTDGDLKQDNDFRLNQFYFIGDVDVLYNVIETEFES